MSRTVEQMGIKNVFGGSGIQEAVKHSCDCSLDCHSNNWQVHEAQSKIGSELSRETDLSHRLKQAFYKVILVYK